MGGYIDVPDIRPCCRIWGEEVQEVEPGPVPGKTRVRTAAGWYSFPNDRRVPTEGLS